jgi:hypothetical protein
MILTILLLAAAVSAQPIPYWVNEPTTTVLSPRITLRDSSTADVFYIMRGDSSDQFILHAVTSLTLHGPLTEPEVLQQTSGWMQEIGDVISRGDSGWAAILYENSPYAENWSHNRTRLIHGQNSLQAAAVLDTGRVPQYWVSGYIEAANHTNGRFRFQHRIGGGSILSWMRFGTYIVAGIGAEPERSIQLGWSTVSGEVETRAACCTSDFLYGPVNGFAVSLDLDTLIVLSLPDEGFGQPRLGWQPFDYAQSLQVEVQCDSDFAAFERTRGGRLLGVTLSSNNSTSWISGIVELTRDGSCTMLSQFHAPADASIRFDPDRGFAILSHLESSILTLSRIDTNGQAAFPVGEFYRCPNGRSIPEASLAISDQGKIAAIWTQRASDSNDTLEMWAASMNWDTPLGADNPHSTLSPSSYSLSAYPNPFNSTLRVEYSLPSAARGELAMYNLLGQKVAVLKDGILEAGNAAVNWTPEGAGGIYFAVLKTATQSRTAKVVYLK